MAQTGTKQYSHPAPATSPLHGVCNGAWDEVNDAIFALRKLHGLETRAVQQKVTCLLDTISSTAFSSRADQQWNDFLAGESIVLLVGAYGPEGYDYFAEQIPQRSGRVRQALVGTLFHHGQPEATEFFFNQRRQQLATVGDDRTFAADIAPILYRSLIVKGECSEPLCSARIGETLRIVSQNLDVVERDLRATVSITPRAQATEQELSRVDQRRRAASELLDVVGRIRRAKWC
jgi:hypothetical protein